MVGKWANGNLTRSCGKLDLVLMVQDTMKDPARLKQFLSENLPCKKITNGQRCSLVFTYKDARIDLTINDVLALATTDLILRYNMVDSRFHKLSIFLRFWRDSDAYYIYWLQMMLLCYMQSHCGTPRLQEADKKKWVNIQYYSEVCGYKVKGHIGLVPGEVTSQMSEA